MHTESTFILLCLAKIHSDRMTTSLACIILIVKARLCCQFSQLLNQTPKFLQIKNENHL